jgi:phosphoribosylformylglycinamidine synthase
MEKRVIVLFGDGINCERETAMAFSHLGAIAEVVHINDLLEKPETLKSYDAMAIPGGFSYGDELGSGKLLALKIKHGLMNEFNDFVAAKKPIIGICNGFQVLVKLGLLNTSLKNKPVTLTQNNSGQFIDRWIDLEVEENTNCKWMNRNILEKLSLPIRHGEGNLTTREEWKSEALTNLESNGNIVLRYTENINGAIGNIAGICSDDGLIFGLMPHPEAAFFKITHPNNRVETATDLGVGAEFFKSILTYLNEGHTHA